MVGRKVHAALGKPKDSAKRCALRDWILKEAEDFGDDDPGGSGKIHLALVDLAEWFELYSADDSVSPKYGRARFDFVLRFDKELKAKLTFARHVVQKSCQACETWRVTKRNLRRKGFTKDHEIYQCERRKFLDHIDFIKGQKSCLRYMIFCQTFPLYNVPSEERWWILDFDLSYPIQHPTIFNDTDARRLLKQFKSLLFGLRDLSTRRSLILTNPGSGPIGSKGKGSWKGLNVTLTCVFLFMFESIMCYGKLLPDNLLFVNDGGERTFPLIMLMGLFVALGWFKKAVSYSCIPGHTHGQTDSLFGLVRKCVKKRAKYRSCTYGELLCELRKRYPGWGTPSDNICHGSVQIEELPLVYNWKEFFRGCRSPLLTGELFPRSDTQTRKPHVFVVELQGHGGLVVPCLRSYVTGHQYRRCESPFLDWTPIFRKYPNFYVPLPVVSMNDVFVAEKMKFVKAIVGNGISRGAAQGLMLEQVEYYELLTLPSIKVIQDPFFIHSGHFRSQEPPPLKVLRGPGEASHKRSRTDPGDDESIRNDDADYDELFDAMERTLEEAELGEVLELKTRPGGVLYCRVRLKNGQETWLLRDMVPSNLVRKFQNQERGRRAKAGEAREVVFAFPCACGQAFTLQKALNIHRGKSKNQACTTK